LSRLSFPLAPPLLALSVLGDQDECVRCHADCGTCDGPGFDDCIECRHEPSSCLSCDTDRRKDASGHCVWYHQCALQSYMDQNGECQQCHKLCHRCSGPGKDHCLSCNEPYFLMSESNMCFSLSFMLLIYKKDTSSPEVLTLHLCPSDDTCVQECPVGYYADKDVRVCERCHFTCQSCVGHHSVECVTCKPGFFKQGINCVETCSERLVEQTTMLCERCDPSCSNCWGHSNRNCLSCREGYVYLRQWGQCLQRCPLGYYQDSQSKTCQKCHPTCKDCTGKRSLSWLVTLFVQFPCC
uniref:Uncharacterized protein n=1 Tax=Acanthochromis polyacanthus TaxID=80966 RepID=A0A3Q1HH90_9TELE